MAKVKFTFIVDTEADARAADINWEMTVEEYAQEIEERREQQRHRKNGRPDDFSVGNISIRFESVTVEPI